ncbi:adenosylcobinamide-GDP ribazoletransferase [Actinoplanes sp. NBRC 103695]|uniref:adenosylcobinamide-GDP ribazoletransferase n=1 Tax=Actinoplanes sp. NBRC 103695 TaxID=3032202 RepID=UPI0024A33714|nr:adenosylcobinamide-GDP ribazoletransferase [Actinoplanes sp. NBRC 103695]GLY93314.1 adenosylcobinamide-GDP ribazoletransferase [Actinoplanes sp. NBRC 103695]
MNGLRLALTTLTVLPLRPGEVDRRSAGVAMSVAPLVGLLLGVVLAGVLWLLSGTPPLVAGGVTVAVAVLLTRGLHLDGLADTVDALGSYRRGAEALDIMKKPDIGPFGVAAIALTLLVQAAAITPVAAVVAWTAGRAALPLACRRGVPPARAEGLGAMVAGTVPAPVAAAIAVTVAVAAWWAVPGRPWQGPAAVLAALLVVVLLLHHAVRRFGGVTGDVLGACVELATTLTLVGLAL